MESKCLYLVRGSFISVCDSGEASVSGFVKWTKLIYFYSWPQTFLSNSWIRNLGTRQRLTYFQEYLGTGNLNQNGDQILDLGQTCVEVIFLKARGAGEFLTASQTPVRPCAERTTCMISWIPQQFLLCPILQMAMLRLTEVVSLAIRLTQGDMDSKWQSQSQDLNPDPLQFYLNKAT